MPGLERQLRWLIGIRLVVITSVLLTYILFQLTASQKTVQLPQGGLPGVITPQVERPLDSDFLYQLAGYTYLASLLYILLLRLLRGRHALQAYIQFLGDLLLITALIYSFGVISNPFSLLYLIVIAVATTLLQRQAGFTVATIAYCLYAGVVLGLFNGWIPTNQGEAGSSGGFFLVVYNLAVHLFGFYAVASLTYILAHRVTRAERELVEKSEDLADLQIVHRDVIQSITSGLITTDGEGVITTVNRAGEGILRTSADALIGHLIYEVDFLAKGQWEELSDAARLTSTRSRTEVEVQRDGTPVYIGFSISTLRDAEGTQKGYIVIFQDFSQWRRLQEEVRIKDRMAAVGELAAGIAHEIGNPLAAISGSVQLLSSNPHGSPEEGKLLDILLKESQRLDRTIKGFLRFARPKDRSTLHFDVARLLAENFHLLENSEEVSPDHRLELELDPPSASLLADPDQISQIFWNLARNALKAMPDGGTLTVGGRLVERAYVLEVSDTGRGMTMEQKANLFHPFQSFFDTGAGIGMAIVYRIVQEHRGRLAVDTQPGRGTRIRVFLPVQTATAALAVESGGGP